MKKNRLVPFILLALWSALLRAEAATVTVSVPGTANPWLAGLPDGATSGGGEDSAPAQSPVLVAGISVAPGTELVFSADGGVVNDNQSPLRIPPDGEHVVGHDPGSENGISTVAAPLNCLMGVFLGPNRPDLTPVPLALDFSSAASRDFESLRPVVKQVFFIGDGRTSTGSVQSIVSPPGATRLFLGTMDGGGWFNNAGVFSVTITSPPFVPSLTIAVNRVKVVQNVALGRRYVLESSHDARSWSEALPPFTATSENVTNEFDVDLTGRFFRVRETP